MRTIMVSSLAAVLGAGCAATRTQPVELSAADVIAAPAADARITLVNEEFRFAVLDFRETTVPAAGTTLDVYRGDRPVGQVRVTEPTRGAFTSADILRGELQLGDRARPGGE